MFDRKKNKTVHISGNLAFDWFNAILIIIFIICLTFSVIDKINPIIEWERWSEDYSNIIAVSAQIITTIIGAIVSIIGVAISLQNNEIFGVTASQLYSLRAEKHYSLQGIIIISVVLCAVNTLFYIMDLTVAALGVTFISVLFIIRVIKMEVPFMTRDEKVLFKTVRNSLIDNYLKNQETPKAQVQEEFLTKTIEYLLHNFNFVAVYEGLRDPLDEKFNEYLYFELLEIQQNLAFSLTDEYEGYEQRKIAESLRGNVLDIIFNNIHISDEMYLKTIENRHYLTRVLFRVHEVQGQRNLLLEKIPALLQCLMFANTKKIDNTIRLISSVLLLLVAKTVAKRDFTVIKEIRKYLTLWKYSLDDESPVVDLFAVLCMYLYYLALSEPDVPANLKKEILDFVSESNVIDDDTRITSWNDLYGIASCEFKVDYRNFINIIHDNSTALEYWLMSGDAKWVILHEIYFTEWYLTALLSADIFDLSVVKDLIKQDEINQDIVIRFFEKCIDDEGNFKPTENMEQIAKFLGKEKEPFSYAILVEERTHEIHDMLNNLKREELKERVKLSSEIDDEKFATEIKEHIEASLREEWGFDSSLEISEEERYFAVILEKHAEASNFRTAMRSYFVDSVFEDIKAAIQKTTLYKGKDFESKIVEILKKKLKFSTSQAKRNIPHFYIRDTTIKEKYIETCSELTEFQSKLLGNSVLVVEDGFRFNCKVNKVEARKLSEAELAERVKKYQRDDGRYVFDGVFLTREEIVETVMERFIVITVMIQHQVESSKDTIFELKPFMKQDDK